MEFLIVWLITIMISLSMEESFKHHITKDIHDSGYKHILKVEGRNNNQTTNKIRRDNNQTTNKIRRDLIHYMPFINLIYQLRLVYTYTINKEDFINKYIVMGLIEEMTEEEFNKYKSTKNYNKAMKELYDNSITITGIQLDDGSNVRYYHPTEDHRFDNIVITEVTGPAKNLSDDQIRIEVEKKIKSDVNKVLKKMEDYEKTLESKENIDKVETTEINKQNIPDCSNEKDKPKTLTKKINRNRK